MNKPTFLILVPSPPQNFMNVSSNSTAISLTWDPPAEHNGVLLYYIITFTYFDMNSNFVNDTVVTADQTETVLTVFAALTYSITIQANTSAGFGDPAENVLIITTPEDGGLCSLLRSLNLRIKWDIRRPVNVFI